jgi:hypothetical protein
MGLKGDIIEARVALAEGVKLKPRVDSVAPLRTSLFHTHPEYRRLLENTVIAGSRRVGFPAA